MELSIKQSETFVKWYMDKYAQKNENGEVITPVEIPKIPEERQREELKEWAGIIYEILWPTKAKQTYKWRTYGDWKKKKETWFEKAFNSLYLQYWPTFVKEDWTVSTEHLWLGDVVDIKKLLKTWEL